MGTEFLVASLWVAVLVYWLWTRRPTTTDTVGLFRQELRVLEFASPNKVTPANRLCAEQSLPAPSPALVAAASWHKRLEVRRRRRDVLLMLFAAVVVTIVAAVLSHSVVALGVQALCDVALACYLCLLFRATRARRPLIEAKRSREPRLYVEDLLLAPPPGPRASVLESPSLLIGAQFEQEYVPAHATHRQAPRRRAVQEAEESYGDFDSYASLALVR
ncbi:MAG TPA: hypothetical protein VME20_05865 [Acidimicrobiales bacterium]|nr:hypothetical protein [Acidimicrobiales bacterium]